MSTEPEDRDQDAEVVQLRPGSEVAVPGAPDAPGTEMLPAGQADADVVAAGEKAPARALYADITAAPGTRRAIIPVYLRRENLRGTAESWAGTQWHKLRYHGFRIPVYGVAYLAWALVGAGRVAGALRGWWWLSEQGSLRSDAVITGNAPAWKQLHREAKETRKTRGLVLLAGAVVVAAGCAWLAVRGPWWGQALACAAAVAGLARAGRPDGHRIVAPAVVPAAYQVPDPELITQALGSLGLPGIDKALKAGQGIRYLSDVYRDGPGWGVVADLPPGVTVAEVVGKREKLASGLRRPLSATWPTPGPEHPGRLHMWIGFASFADAKPIPWPLRARGQADLFRPIPFGADQRGQPVTITLMFASMLIAAMPRMGKSFALRLIALAAALDPAARLRVFDLKGTGDLKAVRYVAHEYGCGADDQTLADCFAAVRNLFGELERRAKVINGLPEALVPESKVTAQLAARRDLGLFPEVLIIDECQEAFTCKELKAEFEDLCVRILKRGPALGIMLVLATQRPDADSLPKTISANVGLRFCLKVMGDFENNAVLGPGMYAKGIRATEFALSEKGIGWLAGHADEPQITRTCYVDAVAADVIGRRARALREAAGTLSGYALGDAPEAPPARDVLGDVLAVFGDRAGLQWDELAGRLAERFPDRWADATGGAVSEQVRDLRVPSADVRIPGAGRGVAPLKGCRQGDVRKAAAGQ